MEQKTQRHFNTAVFAISHDTMIDPKHFTGTLPYCEQCLKVGQTEKDEFYVVSHNMDTRYYVESKK